MSECIDKPKLEARGIELRNGVTRIQRGKFGGIAVAGGAKEL
jgi:DNA integrity scanning protein DisA with diadenylate cyclase activity